MKNNLKESLRRIFEANFFWLILLLSAATRFYQLDHQSYWVDEMTSLHFASQNDIKFLFLDNHPVLYHLILGPWIKVFGFGEFETRSLSCIFSVLTTGVFGSLLFRLTQSKSATMFGMLMHALSAFSVIYAQETRMYSLFELTAALHFLSLAAFKNKKRHWLLVFLSSVALVLTHYVGIGVLAAEGILLLILKYKNRKRILIPSVLFVLIGSMVLVFLVWKNLSEFHLAWQLVKFKTEMTSRFPLEGALHLAHLSYYALIWYIVFIPLALSSQNVNAILRAKLTAILIFMLSILGSATLLTWVLHRSLLIPRYYIFMNPPFILLVVGLIWQFKGKLRMALVLISLTFSIGWLSKAYFNVKAPWNKLAQKIYDSGGTTVYTTRTLTIATPYFNQKNIPVQKLELTDSGLEGLIGKVQSGEHIWIVENYWGHLSYFNSLTSFLTSNGAKFEYFEFETDFSERLSAIKLGK